MFAYIVRRLALMLVTLIGISIVIFFLLRVVPGNIVDILFDAAGFVDPADKANLERELGIDQPLASNICTGSAACCTATSAIPMSRKSPRWRKSCRGSRSPRGSPRWRCCSPPRSAFPSA